MCMFVALFQVAIFTFEACGSISLGKVLIVDVTSILFAGSIPRVASMILKYLGQCNL